MACTVIMSGKKIAPKRSRKGYTKIQQDSPSISKISKNYEIECGDTEEIVYDEGQAASQPLMKIEGLHSDPQQLDIKVEREEWEELADRESDSSCVSVTGKRRDLKSYNFADAEERRLVEFFQENDCFYNKHSAKYSNSQLKDRLLKDMAVELRCDPSKILGWFKNQRTAVGKLLKKKSGQASQPLTTRSRWQLSSFQFLQQYIKPRTYQHDTGFHGVDDPNNEVEPEVEESEPETPTSPTLVLRGSKRCRTSPKVEEALPQFLTQPRDYEELSQKMFHSSQMDGTELQGERAAFGNWFLSRLHRVPENRWDDFTDEAFQLMKTYTRQGSGNHALMQPTKTRPQPSHVHSQQNWTAYY